MTVIFAAAQVVLSQLPNLESIWLVSSLGAACSVGYSLIGLGLGFSSLRGAGSAWGRAAPPLEKTMGVFGGLGNMSVAFYCAMVILEIQVRPRGCRLLKRVAVQTWWSSRSCLLAASAPARACIFCANAPNRLAAQPWIPTAAALTTGHHQGGEARRRGAEDEKGAVDGAHGRARAVHLSGGRELLRCARLAPAV
jgi:hypothetical protein